ncbi:MAG: HAD family hydrolase [Clostridia bacterium]|nr:HAD family hydrolase [Clostridia bacterium]
MIKACIFDLDGTLLDTITTITHYVNYALESQNLPPVTEEECKYFAGNGATLLIERALASKGVSDSAVFERTFAVYNAAYNAAPLHLTTVFDGVEQLISDLKSRGIKLAVLSNKPHVAVFDIVKSFFGDSFDAVFGGREGVPLKPAPDAVFAVLSELGVLPEETAYVGDTGVDMLTGKAFGARKTVGVLWGFRPAKELWEGGADAVVSTVEELLSEVLK